MINVIRILNPLTATVARVPVDSVIWSFSIPADTTASFNVEPQNVN